MTLNHVQEFKLNVVLMRKYWNIDQIEEEEKKKRP